MKCEKCRYGDTTAFNYCYCILFGLKVYQRWNVECCSFVARSDED